MGQSYFLAPTFWGCSTRKNRPLGAPGGVREGSKSIFSNFFRADVLVLLVEIQQNGANEVRRPAPRLRRGRVCQDTDAPLSLAAILLLSIVSLLGSIFWNLLVDLSPNHHETTPQSTPAGSKNPPDPRLKVQDVLVGGQFAQHRAKSRAVIGKCACKNATPSERKHVRGAEGAAHFFAHPLCRVVARAFANERTVFGTMLK